MAPEVYDKKYTHACDMWSAGVILYILLCGYPPFLAETEKEVLELVKNGQYDFDDEVWDNVSNDAKDLIKNLLTKQQKRYTAAQALEHPWIKTNNPKVQRNLSEMTFQRLNNFKHTQKLKQASLLYIASRCDEQEIIKLKNLFLSMDKDNNGYVDMRELREGLKQYVQPDAIQKIMFALDADRNGAVNYSGKWV